VKRQWAVGSGQWAVGSGQWAAEKIVLGIIYSFLTNILQATLNTWEDASITSLQS